MTPFWIQFLVSLTAIGLMVGLAVWAKIARPLAPLTPDQARQWIDLDFPAYNPGPIWIDDEGQGAIMRLGDQAVVLFQFGDRYVCRAVPWDKVAGLQPKGGKLVLPFGAFEAPSARLAVSGTWPPPLLQEAA